MVESSPILDDEDDGEVKGAELLKKKEKAHLYECEKCSKVSNLFFFFFFFGTVRKRSRKGLGLELIFFGW